MQAADPIRLNDVRAQLARRRPASKRALIGLDGFIDEIIEVVDKRRDFDRYERLTTIDGFSRRIAAAAGLSTNIELVPIRMKLGGNGPIMANAVAAAGVQTTFTGALGLPEPHPVFQELVDRCEVISIAAPGHTDALEFQDGKIMLGKVEPMKDVNWDNLLKHVGRERLATLIAEADLAAFVNWTMLPHMTDIWRRLCDEILPQLPVRNPAPWAFFDLADPEKRTDEDIRQAVDQLAAFQDRFRVCLGVNRKEATELAAATGILGDAAGDAPLQEVSEALAARVGVDCLVVHPTDQAACVAGGTYHNVHGPYSPHPKLTTGAGDNFNAGFCLGLLLDLPPEQALVTGVATSGFYVRQAHSPSFAELQAFLGEWAAHETAGDVTTWV